MANWKELEQQFSARLSMSRRPVAVAFLNSVPKGVEKFSGTEPAGCSFWRLAAAGRTFYTVPSDHFNCAIGSYTHNIQLSPERAHETDDTLRLMFDIGYIRPEEVAGIPRLPEQPAAVVYAPLADTPVEPGVVLFTCRNEQAMLLNEAAIHAGAAGAAGLMGRPSCMALPAALQQGTVASLGCIGNRVYTNLGADDLYVVVPGPKLEAVATALAGIASANQKLQDYARGRQSALSSV